MKLFSVLLKSLIMGAALLSAAAQAHVHLHEAAPTPGGVVTGSPKSLSLTFTAPVRVIKLELMDEDGKKLKIGFKPVTDPKETVTQALPVLPAGDYDVHYVVLGKDGHKMENTYTFIVQ